MIQINDIQEPVISFKRKRFIESENFNLEQLKSLIENPNIPGTLLEAEFDLEIYAKNIFPRINERMFIPQGDLFIIISVNNNFMLDVLYKKEIFVMSGTHLCWAFILQQNA